MEQLNSEAQIIAAIDIAHDNCVRSLYKDSYKDKSKTLFHYTDLDGGLAILRNNTLRFTDIRYCNDPQEILDGLNIFNQASEEALDFYSEKSKEFTAFMAYLKYSLNHCLLFESDQKNVKRDLERTYKKIGFQQIYPKINFKQAVYICCLSEKKDDLRQWLPYSKDGTGIAIGFKGFDKTHSITIDPNIWILKVCYKDKKKKKEFVKNLYTHAYELFSRLESQTKHAPHFFTYLYTLVIRDIVASKSENYQDEHEWRLLHTTYSPSPEHSAEYKTRDGIIRPYLDMKFEKDSLLEIKLGPKAEYKLNSYSIRMLTNQIGYRNAKTSKSKIEYR